MHETGCSNGTAVPAPSSNPGLVNDCVALMEGKDALRGTASLNWDYGKAIAIWEGVAVSGTPRRVAKVELQGKSLTGTIPSSLGDLSGLTHLYLQDNELSGSIPSSLGGLSKLTYLNLYRNKLSGGIPSSLGGLSKLRRFYLNENELSGGIPSSLGRLSNLWHLNLNDNKLSGGIRRRSVPSPSCSASALTATIWPGASRRRSAISPN